MLHIKTVEGTPDQVFIIGNPRCRCYLKMTKWISKEKLGEMVCEGRIASINSLEIFYIPWVEYGIVDEFIGHIGHDILCIIRPYKGPKNNYFTVHYANRTSKGLGLGIKSHRDITVALKEAMEESILNSIRPVNLGYFNNFKENAKLPHTVPCNLVGRSRSLVMHLLPAKRGSGIVSGILTRKFLQMAGFRDVTALSHGATNCLGDFLAATFEAIAKSYDYCTPEMEDNHVPMRSASIQNLISANNSPQIVAF